MQRYIPSLVFAGVIFVSGIAAAIADAGDKKQIAVFVSKENSDTSIEVKVDGHKYNFALPELAKGEQRTITTQDGTPVVLNRTADGVTALVAGETINLPALDGKEHELIARFHRAPELSAADNDKSITISGGQLNEEQRNKIAAAIKAAGITAPVRFAEHAVRIIHLDSDDMMDADNIEVESDGAHQKVIKVVRKVEDKK